MAAADAGFVTCISVGGENVGLAGGFPSNSLSYIGASVGDKSLPVATPGDVTGLTGIHVRPSGACLLPANLLWLHNGLGYIYDSIGLTG